MTEKKQAINESNAGLIYKAIPAIMKEIPFIDKGRKNVSQHYSFRGIDDVYNVVNPILSKHKVFMRAEILNEKRTERPSKSGAIMAFVQVKTRYYFVAEDGSSVPTDSLGEGMDSGDKATAKAMSICQKYAILQVFCVPTSDSKDPENDNPEPKDILESDELSQPDVDEKAAFRTIPLILSNGKKKMVTKYEAYEYFGKIKDAIGANNYYALLDKYGAQHVNELADKNLPKAYVDMLMFYRGMQQISGSDFVNGEVENTEDAQEAELFE